MTLRRWRVEYESDQHDVSRALKALELTDARCVATTGTDDVGGPKASEISELRRTAIDSLVVDLLLDCRRQRCVRGMAGGCDPFRSTLVRQTCNASCGATGPQTRRSGRANCQPR